MKNILYPEILVEEAESICQMLPKIVAGLTSEVTSSLEVGSIITSDTAKSVLAKTDLVKNNLSSYDSSILGCIRSISKKPVDNAADTVQKLKAFRQNIVRAIDNIAFIENRYKKRVNLHNFSLGDFGNLIEEESDILIEHINMDIFED